MKKIMIVLLVVVIISLAYWYSTTIIVKNLVVESVFDVLSIELGIDLDSIGFKHKKWGFDFNVPIDSELTTHEFENLVLKLRSIITLKSMQESNLFYAGEKGEIDIIKIFFDYNEEIDRAKYKLTTQYYIYDKLPYSDWYLEEFDFGMKLYKRVKTFK